MAFANRTVVSFLKIASNLGVATEMTPTNTVYNQGFPNFQNGSSSNQSNPPREPLINNVIEFPRSPDEQNDKANKRISRSLQVKVNNL